MREPGEAPSGGRDRIFANLVVERIAENKQINRLGCEESLEVTEITGGVHRESRLLQHQAPRRQ